MRAWGSGRSCGPTLLLRVSLTSAHACTVCDIIMTFRTAFYTDIGLLNWSQLEISRRYLRGWFAIDFAASLPLQYIELALQEDCAPSNQWDDAATAGAKMNCDKGQEQTHRAMRLVRMFRLAKLLRFGSKMPVH
eukprot:SAG11_NODE_15760_length_567_cov_0.997863_1_plen_134_part_10